MKRILIIILFAFISSLVNGQAEIKQVNDTVKITKRNSGDAVLDVKGYAQVSKLDIGSTLDSIVLWDPVSKRFKKTTRADINYHNHTVSQVTSLQSLLDAKQSLSQKGIANGYVPLESNGKIATSFLPYTASQYMGTWNASTNTPTLANGTGVNGQWYACDFDGTVNFGAGSISFLTGQQVWYNGSIWQKLPFTPYVSSVNGFTGTIVLSTNNIAEGGTNYYWTSARSRSAMGITTTGSSGAATYDYVNGIYNIPNYTLPGLGGMAIADTAAMLSNYYRTHVAVSALALKLNIADSAAMLLAYKIKDISHDASISALNADTATLTARFSNVLAVANSKVNISDTATMLNAYRLKDISHDASIALKANYSDTASMLNAYRLKDISHDASIALKANYTDTANMLNAYRLKDISHDASITVKVKYSDTASMLNPYKSAFIASSFDTASRVLSLRPISGSIVNVVIPRGSASGATGISVLSSSKSGNIVTVAGDNGSSTQFSINGSDSATRMHFSDTASMLNAYRLKDISHDASISSLNADTATLAARFANVLAVANAKVNISDTASMLNAYRLKDISHDASIAALNADTATLAARFSNVVSLVGTKLNISDTASMLNAYRLKDISIDATLTIKVNYSDTASMLNAYKVKNIAQDASLLLKVNYSDTASMLNAYRLKDISHDASISALNADTATLAARFSNVLAVANAKVSISDTATMLSPYARDYNVVHKTGTETIAGAKEFSTVPTSGGNAFVLTNDSRMTNSRNAADVYTWAKQPTKPSYDYSELSGTPSIPVVYSWALQATKPAYTYAEIGGTVPTWNQNTTGTATNATYWGGVPANFSVSNTGTPYAMPVYNFSNAQFEYQTWANFKTALAGNWLPLTAGSGNTLIGDIFFGASRAVVFNTVASQIYESGGSIFLRSNSADKLIVHSTGVTLGAIAGTGSVALYAGAITGTTATFSGTVTTGLGGVIVSSTNTKLESDGSSIYLKAAGNTYLNTAASAYVDNGGLLYANSTQIPNGGYYKAIRNTGSASINLLGIESGTDNTVMVASNMFKLRNTGTGDAANLFTVNASGNGVFTGSVSATSGAFTSTVSITATTPILQFSNGTNTGLLYQAGTTLRLSDNSGGKPIVYDFSDGSMSINADKSGYAQQISNVNTNGSGLLIVAGNTSSNYPLNVVDKTNTYNYLLVKGNGEVSTYSTLQQGSGSKFKFGTISPSGVDTSTGNSYNIPIDIDGTTYYLRLFTGTL